MELEGPLPCELTLAVNFLRLIVLALLELEENHRRDRSARSLILLEKSIYYIICL